MARYFKLLAMLWLVGSSLATTTEPTTDAPTTDAPTTDAPTTDAPTTAGQTTAEPTTDAPTTAEPTTDAPTTAEPTTDAPTTDAPTTAGPTTDAPTTVEPTTDAPTTAEPTTDAPTTDAPTTAEPTTDAPTTAEPTTDAPTTAEPTTDAPTTGEPTTDAPTTDEPTTDAPTTADPTTPETTTDPPTTDDPTTPGPTPDPCAQTPCGSGSSCEPRFNGFFVCTCLTGQVYSYERKSCETAKVFPGKLTLAEPYDESLEDRTSERFFSLAERIVDELSQVYMNTAGYVTSTVQRFEQKPDTRVWSRNTGNVVAEVENIFEAAAEITADTVKNTFEEALTEDSVFQPDSTFEAQDLCASEPCDAGTTDCTSSDGSFTCDCLDGFIKTDYSARLCTACPPGQRATDEGCVDCSFGYSGFNCGEAWLFWLVIAGSVLGGLLLISVIVVIVLAARSPKKHRDDDKVKGSNGTVNVFANPGIPTFPRATTSSSMDRRTDMEMTPSNRQQNLTPAGRNTRLYEDPDDMNPYSQSKPQSSKYAQARPQTNQYNQNRPQNPYSSNQGYSNPYFTHDNGRRLY